MRATISNNGHELPLGARLGALLRAAPGADRDPAATATTARRAARASQALPREHFYRLVGLLLFADWVVAAVAIYTGLAIRELQVAGPAGPRLGLNGPQLLWILSAAAVFVWLLMMFRTYETEHLYNINRSMRNVAKAIPLWSLALWAYIGLFRIEGFTPRVGAIYCMVTLAGFFAAWRLVSFVLLTRPAVKYAVSSRILVVGWNEKADHFREAMHMDLAQLGEIVGCVRLPDGRLEVEPPPEVAMLGGFPELREIIREHDVNSLVLADSSCPIDEIKRLIVFCQRELIEFHLVLDFFPALNSGLQVQTVSGVPLLGISQLPLDRTVNRALKRTVDIAGALVGLGLSALVVPWFLALVYLESPGPVFFRQKRSSRGGRTFVIYKIRSMRLEAESGTGAVWCTAEDPRRLRIGAFMRRWNIDELPQFFNVLKGDMSLVGPRPERPELIDRFKHEIPNYNARHEIRAGMTGWAQIHGLRGDTDLRKRIEADLYYLEHWSLTLDLYCVAATFFRVKNAY